jgi:uncharacterized protein YbaP (TraB family)
MGPGTSRGRRRRWAWGLLAMTAVVLVSTQAGAEETAVSPALRPMLYEVETKPRLFLLGTVHAADPRLDDYHPAVRQALHLSDVLYTEVLMDQAALEGLWKSLALPEGESLADLLPEAVYRRTKAAFVERGIDPAMLDRLQVWAVWLQVQGLEEVRAPAAEAVPPALPMDMSLHLLAASLGKTSGALEALEEQVGVFASLTRPEQTRLLVEALDALETKKGASVGVEAVIRAYLTGDPAAVREAMFRDIDLSDPFLRRLYVERMLEERNVVMVRRFLEKAQSHPEKTTMVAVGAGHLTGPRGILALLRETGFRVRKIESVAELSGPWPAVRRKPPVPVRSRCCCRRFGPFRFPLWGRCCGR